MITIDAKDMIMNQFEPDIAVALIEFGKSLETIQADAVIFMARKCLCLYKMLSRLGIAKVEKPILSDRILDMKLGPFRQRQLALVDDTLILGTTLARAKQTLEKDAGARVSVHVFALDTTWWCKDLIRPDSVFLELDDKRLMTFCTAEVRALSLVPQPYIADFPMSVPVRIKEDDIYGLLSSLEWNSFKISTDLQERNGVNAYTLLPSAIIQEELLDALGSEIARFIDLVKIRVFVRRYRDFHSLQFVPIATLKPIKQDVLEDLLSHLLDRISTENDFDLSRLEEFANTPSSQQRLSQHCISVAVGDRFVRSLRKATGKRSRIDYDIEDTVQHYGPWLRDEMVCIGRDAYAALWHPQKGPNTFRDAEPADLPDAVKAWVDESLAGTSKSSSRDRPSFEEPANFVSDFSEIFLHLYDFREIPARKEAALLGCGVLDAGRDQAPNRDRLSMGIPWTAIVEYLCDLYRTSVTPEITNLLGLVLDIAIDMGVAVPVTCVREDTVFRAYRHGEDVKFLDGELALTYEVASGYLQYGARPSIPRLVLEKLLVLLIRVGTALRFLEPFYGASGSDGTARVGFYLRGAVPILVRGPQDRADRDIWMSKYLVKRGVLKTEKSGMYELGENVNGHYLTSTAAFEAFELGGIVGRLVKHGRDLQHKSAPLDVKALTILSTCWPPRHAAAALQVELDIFRRWFDGLERHQFSEIDLSKRSSILECYKAVHANNGYEAIQASVMKYLGYKTDQYVQIVKRCADFLSKTLGDETAARRWTSYWETLFTTQVAEEKDTFDPLIEQAARMSWELYACFAILEVGLTVASGRIEHARRTIAKFDYQSAQLSSAGMAEVPIIGEARRRLTGMSGGNKQGVAEAMEYAVKEMEERTMDLAAIIEIMDPVIQNFGRVYGRKEYRYMLWYDVMDSTGAKAGHEGRDLEVYLGQVRAFKKVANNILQRLGEHAKKNACEIYCWNGDKLSENDEKHVFVRGKLSLTLTQQVLKTLLEVCKTLKPIRLRIYLIACNFAGTAAYRQDTDTEISGERFWEHWSRVKKACGELEKQAVADHRNLSFLVIASEDLNKSLILPEPISWVAPRRRQVVSEIGLLSRKTLVRYGCAFCR
jgi:hypothetical protein